MVSTQKSHSPLADWMMANTTPNIKRTVAITLPRSRSTRRETTGVLFPGVRVRQYALRESVRGRRSMKILR